jgi:mono/diheme cytochrome c family protein
MARARVWFRRALIALVALIPLAAACAGLVWWKFFKSEDQECGDEQSRFKYCSLGGEPIAGIPYPIFMILPRVFPDLVEKYAKEGYGPDKPGWGGYGAFGLSWEQGQRLPVGFSIKRFGYERVTVNCALCHTASYRLTENSDRVFVIGGPGHTANLQGLVRFLFACSHDRRFTAARMLPEMAANFPLDWFDWQLYASVIIPKTRLALQLAEGQLGWMNDKPAWGPGRDDAFNLPKFILLQEDWDKSTGNTDFPALWQLADRDGRLVHAGGEAKTVYAVTATSALGVGSLPDSDFRSRNEWLVSFLRTLPAPKYPATIDQARVAHGQEIYAQRCASCHAGNGARTGTAIPLAEIGTDPERARVWTDADAAHMNRLTSLLGADGAELQGAQGYVAKPLTGAWLLGPYLHNGSVPTLADLLSPPASRPTVFYRGYDVLDQDNVGFVSTGPAAAAVGFRYDTALPGNGNGGHTYGTDLNPDDRRDLLEFLKTL